MSAPTVMIVNSPYEADHKVFMVQSDYQQKNHQLIAGGKLVTSSPNVRVCIVKSEYEADIKITHKNFPKK